MLTHVSAYDEIWSWVDQEQREEVQAWLIAHEQIPGNVHTITLQMQGETATALIEGHVRNAEGDCVVRKRDMHCVIVGRHRDNCGCSVEQSMTMVECKTLPPFTRWPHDT